MLMNIALTIKALITIVILGIAALILIVACQITLWFLPAVILAIIIAIIFHGPGDIAGP